MSHRNYVSLTDRENLHNFRLKIFTLSVISTLTGYLFYMLHPSIYYIPFHIYDQYNNTISWYSSIFNPTTLINYFLFKVSTPYLFTLIIPISTIFFILLNSLLFNQFKSSRLSLLYLIFNLLYFFYISSIHLPGSTLLLLNLLNLFFLIVTLTKVTHFKVALLILILVVTPLMGSLTLIFYFLQKLWILLFVIIKILLILSILII